MIDRQVFVKKLHIHVELLLKICQNNTVHSHRSFDNFVPYVVGGVLGQYF